MANQRGADMTRKGNVWATTADNLFDRWEQPQDATNAHLLFDLSHKVSIVYTMTSRPTLPEDVIPLQLLYGKNMFKPIQ